MMRSSFFLFIALLVGLSTRGLAATEPEVNADGMSIKDIPAEMRRAALEDPDTINKTLQTLLAADNPLRKFIDAANIKFKAFDSDKPGTEKSLGFSYDFSRDFSRYYFSNDIASNEGLTFNISAKGNVAFDKAANPRDF